MNARMRDALDETLILSDKCVPTAPTQFSHLIKIPRIIQDLTAKIIGDVGALYKASEAVSTVVIYPSDINDNTNAGGSCRHVVVVCPCLHQ
jgi:hypothetical protein